MWASGGADGVRQVCGGAFCGKKAVRQSCAMGCGDADGAALSCERWNFCKAVVGIHRAGGVWFVGGGMADLRAFSNGNMVEPGETGSGDKGKRGQGKRVRGKQSQATKKEKNPSKL